MNTHNPTQIFQIRDISVAYAVAQGRPGGGQSCLCAFSCQLHRAQMASVV